MKTHGITTETAKRLIVDAGAIYVNLGEADERVLGATRDGNQFTVEQEVREIPADGAKGPTKGLRRIVAATAKIVANMLEVTTANLLLALVGADASDYPAVGSKTHDSISRDRNILDSDYITNIALVGRVQGSDQPVICIITNALADANLEFSLKDRDEVTTQVTFTGHYDPADLDQEPWEIRFPVLPS